MLHALNGFHNVVTPGRSSVINIHRNSTRDLSLVVKASYQVFVAYLRFKSFFKNAESHHYSRRPSLYCRCICTISLEQRAFVDGHDDEQRSTSFRCFCHERFLSLELCNEPRFQRRHSSG